MTFGQHIRLAGALTCIVAFFIGSVALTSIGLMLVAVGIVIHIDSLEKRLAALEPKENDDETKA